MSIKNVTDTFKKIINGDKLATRLVEEYHQKKIVMVASDQYELKEEKSKDKLNLVDLENALSYTEFFRIESIINDSTSNYYIVTIPTTDDFTIQDTNTTMYNLEIVQENCLFNFSKSVLVKKQDKDKPAFTRTCLFDQATMIVFE